MADEGQQIPYNNEPQKTFKLKPARALQTCLINPDQKIYHPGQKKYMTYLVGNKTFSATMGLDRPRRDCRQKKETPGGGLNKNFFVRNPFVHFVYCLGKKEPKLQLVLMSLLQSLFKDIIKHLHVFPFFLFIRH